MIEMKEKETYLDLCLGMDSPGPILCDAEIHVGLSPHYSVQQVLVQIRKRGPRQVPRNIPKECAHPDG